MSISVNLSELSAVTDNIENIIVKLLSADAIFNFSRSSCTAIRTLNFFVAQADHELLMLTSILFLASFQHRENQSTKSWKEKFLLLKRLSISRSFNLFSFPLLDISVSWSYNYLQDYCFLLPHNTWEYEISGVLLSIQQWCFVVDWLSDGFSSLLRW